jgi:hypothetical protein
LRNLTLKNLLRSCKAEQPHQALFVRSCETISSKATFERFIFSVEIFPALKYGFYSVPYYSSLEKGERGRLLYLIPQGLGTHLLIPGLPSNVNLIILRMFIKRKEDTSRLRLSCL